MLLQLYSHPSKTVKWKDCPNLYDRKKMKNLEEGMASENFGSNPSQDIFHIRLATQRVHTFTEAHRKYLILTKFVKEV